MENQDIAKIITDAISGSSCEVTDLTGTADHWGVKVVWSGFAELPLIQQHKKVLEAVRPYMTDGTNEIHAVQISTFSEND